MTDDDWGSGFGKSVAMYLNGRGISGLDTRGERITDDSFILLFNAHYEEIDFTLPSTEYGPTWQPVLDTFATESAEVEAKPVDASSIVVVPGRSLLVLAGLTE
jgi:glycogen operon protein